MTDVAMTGTTKPVVSVVMIFLNEARFIQEAVESVLAQTYDRLELLLVDDGSTDASAHIAHQYAEQHPDKVVYLEHPGHQNCGTAKSRNLGIHSARGEFITFLDADDVWLPNAVERQLAIMSACPEAGMIYGPTELWHSWSGKPADAARDVLDFRGGRGVPPNTLVQPPELLVHFLRDPGAVPCVCSLLVRRSVVDRIGGFDESFSGLHEDQAFYAKVALASPVFVTDEHWARYRQHSDSVCAVAGRTGSVTTAHRFYLAWLERYLLERDVRAPSLWGALRAQRRQYDHPILHQLHQTVTEPQGRTRAARRVARRLTPARARRWARGKLKARRRQTPLPGQVDFGQLRRTRPISRAFGFDRGLPIDRYYIEQFLDDWQGDIRGRVLEIGDNAYTMRFGRERVEISDVLHVSGDNPSATIIADLADAPQIPAGAFDCVVITQTLHLIYDVRAAVQTLHRILKPGGVVLATFPGISQRSNDEWSAVWYWAFTSESARRLFAEAFPADQVTVRAQGNVLAATMFLYGLAAQELTRAELDVSDPQYEFLISVRAVKSEQQR